MAEEQEVANLIKELPGLSQHVAELKAYKSERRREDEMLQIFSMNSPIGVFIIQDGKFQFVNNEFRRITGAKEGQLIGTDTMVLVHPDDRMSVRENAIKMLKSERYRPYKYRLIHKGVQIRWISEVVVSVQYQGKRAVLGHSSDITELERTQSKLRELYEQERKLREQLQAEAQTRIEFTRALVHELKTPLTPVLASSELLATELHEEPWLSIARNIYRGATNLNRRIDELLDLARVEIGILQVNFKGLDPQILLQGIAGEMTAMLSTNGQSLAVALDSPLPLIWADEERLRQVLLNLMVNASKFSPEGTRITLKASSRDKFLIIEVEDNGPGIPEAEQKELFKPYQRQRRDKEHANGLGLGLALCKKLVELHHGQIWLSSKVGIRTTFSFSIPQATPEQLSGQRSD